MRIYAIHATPGGDKHYRLDVSREWAERNDNGALISCGLRVGTDITERQLKALASRGKAREVSSEEYNHSGCQSSCVLRGDSACRW